MAHTKVEIADYGTEDTLLVKIKNLFINNPIAPFSLVEENFTERPYSFMVSYNKLKIEVYSNVTTVSSASSLSFKIYINTNSEDVLKTGMSVSYSSSSYISNNTTRTMRFLFAKNGNDLVINIASYSQALSKGAVSILDIIDNIDNEIIGYATSINSPLTYLNSENQTAYTIRTYHNAQKSEGVLWLDPELPFYNSNTNEYISATNGITGLGGATKLNTYTSSNGNKYYCCDNNVAINLGTEIEYIEEER